MQKTIAFSVFLDIIVLKGFLYHLDNTWKITILGNKNGRVKVSKIVNMNFMDRSNIPFILMLMYSIIFK